MKKLNDYLAAYQLELASDSGKEIKRIKGFYNHTGIIIGRTVKTKKRVIFHNHPDSGPALVFESVFSNGYLIEYTNKPSDRWEDVLLRSFGQLNSNYTYNAISYNCQDASSYSRTGKTSSSGRDGTIAAVAALALLWFFGGESSKKKN